MKIFSNPPRSVVHGMRVAFLGKLGSMSRRRAKALIRHHGGFPTENIDRRCDLVVMGEEQDSRAAKLPAELHDVVDVIDESRLWQQLGLVDNDVDLSRLYTPAMLAELLRVPVSTIRRWHRRGLITPVRQVQKLPYFDFQEIATARLIARLVQRGDTADSIERQLAKLSSTSLTQLSIIVEGKNVLLREGSGLIATDGQKHFDFGTDDPEQPHVFNTPDSILLIGRPIDASDQEEHSSGTPSSNFNDAEILIPFEAAAEILRRTPPESLTPDELIELAIEAEDDGDESRAVEFYRALSLASGPSADVNFRIAELLYQSGDLTAARERYFMAIELDETFVEARASLGCVLAELGQRDLAIATFRGALEHHPDFPDVHYHLARLLDDAGKVDSGHEHWEAFLQLAPKSPWAEEARGRLQDRALDTEE